MFMIINNICITYQAVSPLELEDTPYEKVINLYTDLRKVQIRMENAKGKPKRRKAADNAGWW